MMEKHPPEDEIERLAEHYEQLGDEDVLAEWERGEPVAIDVGEPMVLARCAFPGTPWIGCVRWPARGVSGLSTISPNE